MSSSSHLISKEGYSLSSASIPKSSHLKSKEELAAHHESSAERASIDGYIDGQLSFKIRKTKNKDHMRSTLSKFKSSQTPSTMTSKAKSPPKQPKHRPPEDAWEHQAKDLLSQVGKGSLKQ